MISRKPFHSDNLVLVPASELPFMDEWKHLASTLPQASALVVMPSHPITDEGIYKDMARQLASQGRQVKLYRARRGKASASPIV